MIVECDFLLAVVKLCHSLHSTHIAYCCPSGADSMVYVVSVCPSAICHYLALYRNSSSN